MDYHPIVGTFDPLTKQEREKLRESIEQSGCRMPVVFWTHAKKRWCIDGRHRVEICTELGVPYPETVFKGTEQEAITLAESLNDARRHRSWAERQERIASIAERRKNGESLRVIAEAEGVSEKQVRRDLAKSGASPAAPDVNHSGTQSNGQIVGEVTGKDGRKYKVKPVILCDRCQRIGATEGCNGCKEARAKAKKPKKKKKQSDALHDDFGKEIPKRCRDVWADTWIQDTYDSLCLFAEDFRKKRFADGIQKRIKRLPFFEADEIVGNLAAIDHALDSLIEHIKVRRPSAVCSACEGSGCPKCRESGLVPREVYEETLA